MTETLFDLPSAPVTDETAAILDLLCMDPIHARDRATIVRAIVAEAHARGGRVDPNRLRARLCDENGNLRVYPRVVGATVHALVRAGVLVPDGWVTSTDRRGRNAGKPARAYRARIGQVAA